MATLDPLISKLICLLEGEASLIANVRDELREMQLELETMRSFLKDADSATSNQNCKPLGCLRSSVYKSVHFLQDLCLKRRIASKLQKVKSAVDAISKRRQRYQLDRPREIVSPTDRYSWLRAHHESALFLEEDEVVGFRNAKKKIAGWLLSEEMERMVISVWGLGGSGKTTLLANVYNNPRVKRHYDCYAWVTISQTYEIRDILAAIMKDFCKSRNEPVAVADVGSMDYRSLVDFLVNYLENKRYVIVFDDVWDLNLWNQLRIALPNKMHGSRVMISTRYQEVACSSFGVQSYVHHNEPLEKDEAFDLFCKKAFFDKACPDNLKTIVSKLVDRCEGLPLALVALGGALFNKTESEWSMVNSSLTWQLANNPGLQKMKTILLLSYHALSHRLKLCFLYCSVFPEDDWMSRNVLAALWHAEGFIEEVGGLTPEQVAESYFMELIRRSLLQVVKSEETNWDEYYKMHDILRETAIWNSKCEKFCTIYKDKEAIEGRNCHIQSIQENIDLLNEPRLRQSLSKVRSFFLFIPKQVTSESIKLPSGFQLLRVLDLSGLNIDKVPDDIENCYNLRYLNMSNTEVRELPKSIGNLTQLLSLNLSETNIQVLPSEIAKLHNLRHLIVSHKYKYDAHNFYSFSGGVQVTTNIGRLKNLHALISVQANVHLVGKLKCLTNLRELGLDEVTEEVQEEMCLAINKMEYLYSLWIITASENTVLCLEPLSSTAPHLKVLSLHGKLEKVPGWFQCSRNLTRLILYWTRFEDDVLLSLEALPNLAKLTLWHAYVGKQLSFRKGFQKLRELLIFDLPQLNKIIMEEGVMPNLDTLLIANCKELKTAPTGIKYLASLETIFLQYVSSELASQIHEEFTGCEHSPKIVRI